MVDGKSVKAPAWLRQALARDAVAVSILPLAALVRRPTSAPRPVAEAFITALAIIALVWLAWVALWLLEQRW